MTIAGVEFPEPLLNALRDGRLVVFAGAGVSMGPPANLPGFPRLAEQVAEGTGTVIAGNGEKEEQFLGRLKDNGTNVHQRAAEILQRNNPQPTALHQDLPRLFGKPEEVRIVTTNFDDLFERAVPGLFNPQPKLFVAPALPLGNRFSGIVHLHGSWNEPEETVLTAQDFGRAYLTEEDGWARRFLVALFTNYTVLFVGYSHSDTIMTYLTPSLPPDDSQKRFALIGDQRSDDIRHWRRMGVEPVQFRQINDKDFCGLDKAINGLANRLRSGVLDWQREITSIASEHPPIDEESTSIIEHALSDPTLTRFFTESAESPEWLKWLDRRDHLLTLFNDNELDERDRTLIWWVVSNFAIAHSTDLFGLIGQHGGEMNRWMWSQLVWQMRGSIQQSPDATVITRWVLFLARTVPPDAADGELSWLAESCASVGETNSLLRVYRIMLERRNSYMLQHAIQEVLSEHVRPNLHEMAEPLLTLTTMLLKEHHAVWTAWDQVDTKWNPDNYSRSAIEPHEQDDINAIDALIDTARECLEYLAANTPAVAGTWSDRHSNSGVPLLRRLAIHANSARVDLSDDAKIAWLLERCDVNEVDAHHEIFRAAAQSYPQASSANRQKLIEAIFQCQALEREPHDSDKMSAYHQFNWFHWLHETDPNCQIAKDALDIVWKRRPELNPWEHPEFTHWHWSGRFANPWSAETLLEKPAVEALYRYLTYHPTAEQRFNRHDKSTMAEAIGNASLASVSWGLDMANAIAGIKAWDLHIWHHLFGAWRSAEIDINDAAQILPFLSEKHLIKRHTRAIASVLGELARKTTDVRSPDLLNAVNSTASSLRQFSTEDEVPKMTASVGGIPKYVNWTQKALTSASGQLALFWLHSTRLWKNQQQNATSRSLSSEYQNELDTIIMEPSISGKLGRTVLASNFQFFLAVDEEWTMNNLAPLFDTEHEEFQCAWDGFLTWGRLSYSAGTALQGNFVSATPRVAQEFSGEMTKHFVNRYAGAMVQLINGANDIWISEFFKYANTEMKQQFAWSIYHQIRSLDESKQRKWWGIWLKDYWKNRLQGVPTPLEEPEISWMLEWAMHLPGVFPEAVNAATQMRPIPLNVSSSVRNIGESDLIERHPDALAKLLIHFGKCDTHPWFWHRTRDAADKILAKEIPLDIKTELQELVAKYAPWMGQ